MAKDDFLRKLNQQRKEVENKRLNIALSSAEKLGIKTPLQREFDWEIMDAIENPTQTNAENEEEERTRRDIYKVQHAHTINPPRPRALKVGYSKAAAKLIVKFRDGTDWEYNDIPQQMWQDLKVTNSTGRYLRYSGLDTWVDMGPFDTDLLGPSAAAQWET